MELSFLGMVFVVLICIVVPPLLVLVSAPRLGMAGFMAVMLIIVGAGIYYFELPFYFLVLAGVGAVVMLYGMVKRG